MKNSHVFLFEALLVFIVTYLIISCTAYKAGYHVIASNPDSAMVYKTVTDSTDSLDWIGSEKAIGLTPLVERNATSGWYSVVKERASFPPKIWIGRSNNNQIFEFNGVILKTVELDSVVNQVENDRKMGYLHIVSSDTIIVFSRKFMRNERLLGKVYREKPLMVEHKTGLYELVGRKEDCNDDIISINIREKEVYSHRYDLSPQQTQTSQSGQSVLLRITGGVTFITKFSGSEVVLDEKNYDVPITIKNLGIGVYKAKVIIGQVTKTINLEVKRNQIAVIDLDNI